MTRAAFKRPVPRYRRLWRMRKLALLTALWALAPSAHARADEPAIVPLRLTLLTESVSLPDATRMFAEVHPGPTIGSELPYHRDAAWTFYQGLELGLVHHEGRATTLVALTTLGARPFVVEALFIDVNLGVGYLAHLGTAPVFEVTAEGAFRRQPDALHRFAVVAGLALGYAIEDFAPFVGYRILLETPFLARYSPVLPHQIVELGLRVQVRP